MFSKLSKGAFARYEPLPDDPRDADLALCYNIQQRSLRRSRLIWKTVALVELLLVAVLLAIQYNPSNAICRPHSIVDPVLLYENRVFYSGLPGDRSAYQGPPSAEVDAAWDTLFDGTIVRISAAEEHALPNRTAPLPGDAGGHITGLEVVHHLHCLNAMRKSMWPEYYGPSVDIFQNASMFKHQEHCVELLRQAHMCNPDTTAISVQWDPVKQYMTIPYDTQHTCVNYERIQQWMKSRPVSEFDPHVYLDGGPVYARHN